MQLRFNHLLCNKLFKESCFFPPYKKKVPVYIKAHNILIKKKRQIMSSLTSKLQPTLTPPPQQRKNKITMPQLYSIVHFDSSGQTEISSDWCSSQNKTIKLLLMGSFYKAYFARESYLRSNCENKKELAQRRGV